ncbi:MAG: substrate-binding domain-containing protein [Christensenellaceae bacterium]|nr:substrate-binding domain-containing protein [Christensenellaceae bacterium]
MKRLFIIIAVLIMMFSFAACSSAKVVMFVPQDASQSDSDAVYEDAIGFIATSGEGVEQAFFEAANKYAKNSGYELIAKYSLNALQQADDILLMLEEGVGSVIIIPADPDALGTAAEECNAAGVQLINLLDPINARVSTLICPDYSLIGIKGARLAKEAKKDRRLDKLNIYLLETDFDSFTMQLIHDGFVSELGEDGKLLGVSHFSQEDLNLDDPFGEIREDISKATVIFAFNEKLAELAMAENPSAAVICCGASKETLEKVSDKSFYASVFYGADEMAKNAVEHAVACAKDSAYVPPEYIELSVGVASESSVENYITASANGYPDPIVQ